MYIDSYNIWEIVLKMQYSGVRSSLLSWAPRLGNVDLKKKQKKEWTVKSKEVQCMCIHTHTHTQTQVNSHQEPNWQVYLVECSKCLHFRALSDKLKLYCTWLCNVWSDHQYVLLNNVTLCTKSLKLFTLIRCVTLCTLKIIPIAFIMDWYAYLTNKPWGLWTATTMTILQVHLLGMLLF